MSDIVVPQLRDFGIERAIVEWLDDPECSDRLCQRWPAHEVGRLAAEMYFLPLAWQPRYSRYDQRTRRILTVLRAAIERWPPPDIVERIEQRLKWLMEHPFGTGWVREQLPPTDQLPEGMQPFAGFVQSVGTTDNSFEPTIAHCLELLASLPDSAGSVDLTDRFLRGDLNFGPHELPHWRRKGSDVPVFAYTAYPIGHMEALPRLLERLWRHGRLGYSEFVSVARLFPALLGHACVPEGQWGNRQFHAHVSSEFSRVVLVFCAELAWELANRLSDEDARLLTEFRTVRRGVDPLRGRGYLKLAAKHHAARGMKKLRYKHHEIRNDVDAAIVLMANVPDAEPADPAERKAFIEELRAYPPASLKHLLPVAAHARGVLAEALGLTQALPLIREVLATAGVETKTLSWMSDVRHSTDPTLGVLDVPAAQAAIAEAGTPLAREVLTLFRLAQTGAENAALLYEAVGGWNRPRVLEGLAKRNQTCVKAYGLLPLQRGDDELIERYTWLKQFTREARQWGAKRRATGEAAAEVALANLSQTAGRADHARLELLTAARHGEAPVDDKARGKQTTQLRAMLLDLMLTGERLPTEHISALLALDGAREQFEKLVLRDDSGFGMLDVEALELRTVDGARHPLGERVGVAHAFELLQAGVFGSWQREIVHRRVVQPFKQVFREVYVLTPAEVQAVAESSRFAGHQLDAARAFRLLQSRGWRMGDGEVAEPRRYFPHAGIQALFEIEGAGHYLSEQPVVTSGRILFWEMPRFRSSGAPGKHTLRALALRDVPPTVFSEVMRDADLVVTVAQHGGGGLPAREVIERRMEILRLLLEDLQLEGVELHDNFATVKGSLATYRVHLGTAAIYVEPGQHLCIVPARWGKRHERLFLPFVDAEDDKVGEVVSKVLFLLNDSAITDKSILRQFRRQ